ncbi:MAG: hypothetical protein A3F72_15285 [Bacteroidetes bacterium RIFCSPLOWO2_12_FULL_35_15]|nr:MAG: hypothetical protein A3F72_15285 [Bacteroidetes bacterium RIFCSPLOWO2_12_FULL_35_15]
MNKIDFANKYYPLAKEAGEKYNLNPVVILAQAAHESGWGDSYGARIRRNFFGVIAAGKPNAYWKGEKNQSTASGLWFRVYPSAQDSISDFARLITSSNNYNDAEKVSFDTPAYAKAIAYSPYISETNGDNRPAYEKAVRDNADFFSKILGPQILRDQGKKKSDC